MIATGIQGATAVCQIGAFHRSSPIHDRATFIPFTVPGAVLDGARLLVTSSSNYGAPLANTDQFPGTVLSIDPNGASAVAVPGDFATAGGQASAAGGAVTVYAANGPTFKNALTAPAAVTANEVSASLPLGISLNNGNGRPWIANAPNGPAGNGSVTVLDPSGVPLAGAPDPVAGGVFLGNGTNRNAASTHGVTYPAISTAIISKSSDGTGRAVFALRQSDGAIVQVHVQKGVDGLIPAGTLTPNTVTPEAANSNDRRVIARAGMAFNWAPNRVIYAADPQANKVVAFDITDDGTFFYASAPRPLVAPSDCGDGDDGVYSIPVDVAPTVPEVGAENFSSNTTLAVGADVYVLNRGNNTVVRITQDGHVVGKRRFYAPGMWDFAPSGMGVSPDGQRIFITGQTAGNGGAVIEIPAFGSGDIMEDLFAKAQASGAKSTNELGQFFFNHTFTIPEGVGPMFNAQSCVACHGSPTPGGMSSTIFDTLVNGPHGPTARDHSISEIGGHCSATTGVPHDATASSRRSSMTLRGTSLIDFVLPTEILKNQALEPAAVRGRPNILADGRIGRFGWKASTATLIEFMGGAYRNEMGLTNGLERRDLLTRCGANRNSPELDALPLVTTAAYLSTVDAPAPTAACLAKPGKAVFEATGCNGCHTPSFPGPGFTAFLYSDLLLHDMGPALADGFVQGSATGSEFRTMTLTNLGERSQFLHDGRALTVTDAITAHGGQGAASATAFGSLSDPDKAALLDFLGCL